ncbi:hypothetical protein THTE_2193 [Thermogutta terrifontis]|uniref:Uncharacterized protein n=1 Tax=Thermogutta terrifontis TaxID=1331910 RepID=A0A286RFR5_9BACT|nr:hypothetical protein THTE_2193 [Thermogutta terrifontis]
MAPVSPFGNLSAAGRSPRWVQQQSGRRILDVPKNFPIDTSREQCRYGPARI